MPANGPSVEPLRPPQRPDHPASCTCLGPNGCMAWAMSQPGGCPGGGYTARQYAAKRPQG